MFKLVILLLVYGASFNVFSQDIKYDTHSIILKGELTSEDIYEKDFGRFDAYELQMEEGDIIKMRLTASFFPLMIVAAPSSEYKMAFPQDNNTAVIFEQEIDESGLWYIYIAGDSLDIGDHSLELCYVSNNSRKIPIDAEFVTLVEFFLAHSNTNYFYLKDHDCENISGKWEVKLDSYDKYKSAKVVGKNNISTLTIIFETERDLFIEMTSELKNNFAKSWNVRVNDTIDLVELFEIEGLRKITLEKKESGIVLKISTK